jgi:hypothetical protein
MLHPDYLSRNLTSPIPTKDGGTLRTIGEACKYMAAIDKEREQRRHWQQVRELMLQEADVAAVSRQFRLAVLKDAKVDVTALSGPIERWMDEPSPSLLSNDKLKVVEVDEPPREPAAEEEELRRQEEVQRVEARQAAEDKCHRQEELQRVEVRQAAEEEEELRRQEELQRAEARQAAEEEKEEERRRQEAENKPFWNRFLAMLRARDSDRAT